MSEQRPLILVRLAGTNANSYTSALGEPTDCPYLAVTPAIDLGGPSGRHHYTGYQLTHVPTGMRVPESRHFDPGVPRCMARLLAELDWSSADPGTYLEPSYGRATMEARDRTSSGFVWDEFGAVVEP